MKDGLKDIIGKTITSVIVASREGRDYRDHVFLVFADDTSFEFWGPNFSCIRGIYKGGMEYAINYTKCLGAKVINIYPKNLSYDTIRNASFEKAARIRTLEHLSYILECLTMDYLGEARTELLALSNLLLSDRRYEFPGNQETAKSLKEIMALYMDDKIKNGTTLLNSLNRRLWKDVMKDYG